MALQGRQVRQLRSLAHHLEPVVTIGKSDITQNVVDEADAYLERHELMKCNVLDGSSLGAKEAAGELAQRTDADVVQVIGRRFTLYRRSQRDDIEHIKLV